SDSAILAGNTGYRQVACHWMAWSDKIIPLLELGIGDKALGIVHWRGSHTDLLQHVHDLSLASSPRPGGEKRVQLLLMCLTTAAISEPRIGQPLRVTHDSAEVLPLLFAIHRNRHPLILSLATIHVMRGHHF